MAFEIFRETGTRTREFISITETKTFGLSRAFLDKHNITSEHKAVIFYDSVAHKIALHFSLNNPKFGFSVRIANKKHGAIIIARSFFDLKNIDTKKFAGRYSDFEIVTLEDIGQHKPGEAYVITLKESVLDNISDEPINLADIPF